MSKKNCIFSAFLVKNEFFPKFYDTEWFVENLWIKNEFFPKFYDTEWFVENLWIQLC
jgi:hypothetical protein